MVKKLFGSKNQKAYQELHPLRSSWNKFKNFTGGTTVLMYNIPAGEEVTLEYVFIDAKDEAAAVECDIYKDDLAADGVPDADNTIWAVKITEGLNQTFTPRKVDADEDIYMRCTTATDLRVVLAGTILREET